MCASLFEDPSSVLLPYHRFSTLLDAVFPDGSNKGMLTGIKSKRQSKTLAKYLRRLRTSWFAIERRYVDKDFMDDYANYYSRCFHEYGKFCCRVHFFDFRLDEDLAKKKILGRMDASGVEGLKSVFAESYLGFIVFRPLPITVYGRVCLRPLASADCGDTRYLAVQNIDVNLWGIPLSVKTMPYQEQDTVVAACATSALWSAFQITGRRFRHCIPSPHRITNLATQGGACEYRAFPSKGLSCGEIGRSIFKVGLAQQEIRLSTPEYFRAEIYAYLRFGLPVILIAPIRYAGRTSDSDDWHAVTVCGFTKAKVESSWTDLVLEGSGIERLYCHDDRIGPFTELVRRSNDGLWETTILEFKTNDIGIRTGDGKALQSLSVQYAFVPVYHKIRIQLTDVFVQLKFFFDSLAAGFRIDANFETFKNEAGITWDIYLATDDEIKQKIRAYGADKISDSALTHMLSCDMPKYVWIVSAFQAGFRCVTFLVDATGIAQDINVFLMFSEDDGLKEAMQCVAQRPEMTLNPFARCILNGAA